VLVNVPFGALLERRHRRRILLGLDLLPRGSLLRDDVDTGGTPVALHAEPGCIACQPRILQRHVAERAQAMPALLSVLPIAIGPVLRRCARDDEVEAAAIGVLAGFRLALDLKGFQLSSHVVPPVKTVRRTHGAKLRFQR